MRVLKSNRKGAETKWGFASSRIGVTLSRSINVLIYFAKSGLVLKVFVFVILVTATRSDFCTLAVAFVYGEAVSAGILAQNHAILKTKH